MDKQVKEMNLKRSLSNNIIAKEDYLISAKEVINILADAAEKTFGPNGSNSGYNKSIKASYSKDGVTILGKIKFFGALEESLSFTFREISNTINTNVGDGTTSAILAGRNLLNLLLKEMEDVNSPLNKVRKEEIMMLLEKIACLIYDKLNDKSVKLYTITDKEELLNKIHNVATISLNNNPRLAELFKKAYELVGVSGTVNIEKSMNSDHYVNMSDGHKLVEGYWSPILVNNEDRCELHLSDVLLFNGLPNNMEHEALLKEIITEYIGKSKALTIIVSNLSERMAQWCHERIYANTRDRQNTINIIRIAMGSRFGKERLNDIAALTGAKPIDVETILLPGYIEMDKKEYVDIAINEKVETSIKEIKKYFLGKIDSIISYRDHTMIKGCIGESSELVNARLKTIDIEIERMKARKDYDELELFDLEKRRSFLSNNTCTIYIGGETELYKDTTRDLFEDANKAINSFINNGYSIGCNMAIPFAIKDIEEKAKADGTEITEAPQVIFDILNKSFEDLYRTLLKSSIIDLAVDVEDIVKESYKIGDVLNLITGNMGGVINPTDTDIFILKAIIEIVGLVVTCDQFIIERVSDNTYSEVHSELFKEEN